MDLTYAEKVYPPAKGKRAALALKMSQEIPNDENKNNFASPCVDKIPTSVRKNRLVKALLCPIIFEKFYNIRNELIDPSSVRQDICVLGCKPIVNIHYPSAVALLGKTMSIGCGSDNHVNLDYFGECDFTSRKHAIIFYNERESEYEMANYSNFGTEVSHHYYYKGKDTYAKLDQGPSGSFKLPTTEGNNLPTDISKCKCDFGVYDASNVEKTFVVPHGSLLKFGCKSFIFSIIEGEN